jgi:DNA-directed RNA polymerase subunit M/transcription elongation factor TFIIS
MVILAMPETVAVACAECGAMLHRHPAMRLRRLVCFACQKKRKNENSQRRRAARKDLARSAVKRSPDHTGPTE